jgi:hypothetical protein
MSDTTTEIARLREELREQQARSEAFQQLYQDARKETDEANEALEEARERRTTKSRKSPKVATPLPYSGKMSETKAFAQACAVYMMVKTDEFETERDKILWVLSYMQSGTALKYRESFLDTVSPVVDDPESWGINTVKGLLDNIATTFGDPNITDTKIFEITSIVQGERTADEHVQDFKIAAHGSGWDGLPLIYEFKRSLSRPLREKLNNLERRPTTIEGWYSEAMRLDRQWRQAKLEEKVFSTARGQSVGAKGALPPARTTPLQQKNQSGGSRPTCFNCGKPGHLAKDCWAPKTAAPRAPAAKDPNAMDVDAGRRPPLKCYKCGQMGHFARDCKVKLDLRSMNFDEMKEFWVREIRKDEKKGKKARKVSPPPSPRSYHSVEEDFPEEDE